MRLQYLLVALYLFAFPLVRGQNDVKIDGNLGIGTQDPVAPLHILNGSMFSSISDGYLRLGQISGVNMAFDNARIQSYNNSLYSTLLLQPFGGFLKTGGGFSVGTDLDPPVNGLRVEGRVGVGGDALSSSKMTIYDNTSSLDANLDLRSTSQDFPSTLMFSNNESSFWRLSGNAGTFSKFSIQNGLLGTTSLYIEGANNNTGIGTTNPDARLHIFNNGDNDSPQLILEEEEASDYARLHFRNNGQSREWAIQAQQTDLASTSFMRFGRVPGATIMYLRGDGRVSIGQNDQSAKVHIYSNSTGSDPQLKLTEAGSADFARLTFENSTVDSRWTISGKTSETNAEARLHVYNSGFGGNIMSISGEGMVGLGTEDFSAKMHVKSNGSGSDPQLLLTEDSNTDYARLSFQNNSGDSRWTIAGKTSTTNSDAELNFYNSGLGSDVMSLKGDGQVGIGTTSPTDKLHIASGFGEDALRVQVNGSTKFRIHDNGGISLLGNTSPSPNEVLFETGTTDIIIRENSAGEQPEIITTTSGFGLIGNSSAPFDAVYADRFYGLYLPPSDRRFKENIKPIGDPFALLTDLNAKRYAYTEEYYYRRTGHSKDEITRQNQYGFIAQEVEEVMPEIVNTDRDGFKSLNYVALVPVLVQAVKDLKEENTHLLRRIEQLEQNQDLPNTHNQNIHEK